MQRMYRKHDPELCKDFSWSRLYFHRRQARANLRSPFSLPIARRARDVLLRFVKDADRVLEIGAGDRRMEGHLHRRHAAIRYESCDPDPQGGHDYRGLDEPKGPYDVVFAFEVIEHLEFEEIASWLSRIADLLAPAGALLLSTPNTYYPPAYLRDATHRTPLCYDELAGLVGAAGLEVLGVWRAYNDPPLRVLLRRYLFGWLFRLIGIDYARQIVLAARRPASPSPELQGPSP
jgi:hypothetical protein